MALSGVRLAIIGGALLLLLEPKFAIAQQCPVNLFVGTFTTDGHRPWDVTFNLTTGRLDGTHPGGGVVRGAIFNDACDPHLLPGRTTSAAVGTLT
jgi:hypothetical protein